MRRSQRRCGNTGTAARIACFTQVRTRAYIVVKAAGPSLRVSYEFAELQSPTLCPALFPVPRYG
jgi:hypothetical protein